MQRQINRFNQTSVVCKNCKVMERIVQDNIVEHLNEYYIIEGQSTRMYM